MAGTWSEIFEKGNYVITTARYSEDKKSVYANVDFMLPDNTIRQSTIVHLKPEPRSKDEWTIDVIGENLEKLILFYFYFFLN